MLVLVAVIVGAVLALVAMHALAAAMAGTVRGDRAGALVGAEDRNRPGDDRADERQEDNG